MTDGTTVDGAGEGQLPLSESMKREQLDDIARAVGIANPEGYKNKGEVIAAIEAVRGGADPATVAPTDDSAVTTTATAASAPPPEREPRSWVSADAHGRVTR